MTTKVPRPPLGFPLLFQPDADGALSWVSLEDSVRQSIEVILRTRPGEQLLHEEFGAGLEDLLGEPNTLTVRSRIRELVQGAIVRWEPRVELERVDVLELADRPNRVRVEITYRLRRTGTVQQIGLAMDLGG